MAVGSSSAACHVCLFVTTSTDQDQLGYEEAPIVALAYVAYDCMAEQVLIDGEIPIQPADEQQTVHQPNGDMNGIDGQHPDQAEKNAALLPRAIRLIDERLQKLRRPFTFVCDGQAPMRLVLHHECVTGNIELPPYYYRFYDLRKEFRKCYPLEAVHSIQQMIDHINAAGSVDRKMDIVDEMSPDCPRSALLNCRQMVVIMRLLTARGHRFCSPEIIKIQLEPGLCFKNDYVDDETVVRARGLPWQCSDLDIARFFKGLNIARGGVALCLSSQGRRNGEALIRFDCREHRDLALKKHKHHLGGRYIEVYRASGRDFVNVAGGCSIEAQNFLSTAGDAIIRMRGLPYTCTAEQIVEFFRRGTNKLEINSGHAGILFVKHPDGRATGDAFVTFGSEAEGDLALKKHRECIGSRYIELFKSTGAEVQQVLNKCLEDAGIPLSQVASGQLLSCEQMASTVNATNGASAGALGAASGLLLPGLGSLGATTTSTAGSLPAASPGSPINALPPHLGTKIFAGTKKNCIHIKLMPKHATIADILTFLGEHSKNISYQGVHLVYNNEGVPSGEAFIQMETELAAESATITRNNKYMHLNGKKHYLDVKQVSGNEVNQLLGLNTPMAATPTLPLPAPVTGGADLASPMLQLPQMSQLTSPIMPMYVPFSTTTVAPAIAPQFFDQTAAAQYAAVLAYYPGTAPALYPSPPASPGHSRMNGGTNSGAGTNGIVHANQATPAPLLDQGASPAKAIHPLGQPPAPAPATLAPQPQQPIYYYPSMNGAPGLMASGSPTTPMSVATTNGTPSSVAPPPLTIGAPQPPPALAPIQLTHVLLQACPSHITAQDILAFFANAPGFIPESIQLAVSASTGTDLDVFVAFLTQADAERAILQKNQTALAGQPAQMFLITTS